VALGVQMTDLLPATCDLEEMAVARQRAKKLFDELLRSDDRAVLLVLTQVLARLAEATNR
jgi:hypothetical protein